MQLPVSIDCVGLIPRLVVALFENIYKCSEDIEFLVKVSYVEIYMERIRDLLDISKDNLAIREDKAKNIYIESVTEVRLNDLSKAHFPAGVCGRRK